MKKRRNQTSTVSGQTTQTVESTKTLNVKIHGDLRTVLRADYVRAKTKDLREFGYPDVTEKEVDEQITAIQEGRKFGNGLTVIGKFIEDDIR